MLDVITIHPITFASECYIAYDTDSLCGIVIDPSSMTDEILERASERGIKLEMIVVTHSHFDHIYFLDDLRERARLPVAVHRDDAHALTDAYENASEPLLRRELTFGCADVMLDDGDTVAVGNEKLTVMHTPGHTKGSICLVGQGIIFSGDTVFEGSVGRCDLFGGDHRELAASIKKLAALKGEYTVYPGHGAKTTLDSERKRNPYFR